MLDGAGAHVLQVGAGARLGHAHAGDVLAAGKFRQVALLLRLGAVALDVMCGDHVDLLPAAEAGVSGQAEFVGQHGLMGKVAIGAAIFTGNI
ncbi:hypothetical protein D9M68_813300 [compost metagenome]